MRDSMSLLSRICRTSGTDKTLRITRAPHLRGLKTKNIKDMKRSITFIMAALLCFSAAAQSEVDQQLNSFRNSTPPPRKESLKDVPSKTLKVVLAGDESLMDMVIKDAVEKNWHLSPFEFITRDEFQTEKTDSTHYFLIRINKSAGWRDDSGLEFLSFRKGAPEASENMDEMKDIFSLPLGPEGEMPDRILPFIPAYITIIQKHIEQIIDKNINAYLGMAMYNDLFDRTKYDHGMFLQEDFSFSITPEKLASDTYDRARIVTADEMEEEMDSPSPRTLVSLVIYPTDPNLNSSNAYQMLICSDTQELVYYHKHKFTRNKSEGFTKIEYVTILKYFK